ncbi:MAG: class I SAM-dependent methyltransferase [Pirellula sp.]
MNEPPKELTPSNAPIGMSTMSPAMADMQHYPAYLLQLVNEHLGPSVWEIGIGNGQTVRALIARGHRVVATDVALECLEALCLSLQHSDQTGGDRVRTLQIDLNAPSSLHPLRDESVDSVISFNVLEHIENDAAALAAIRSVVPDHAVLGLIVPAHPSLYGKMDAQAGHYRRYTRATLRSVLEQSGWAVQHCRYVNALGAAGWWYHNRWRRDTALDDPSVNHQMRFADRWLPTIAKVTDFWLGSWFGLSVLAIATAAALPNSPPNRERTPGAASG